VASYARYDTRSFRILLISIVELSGIVLMRSTTRYANMSCKGRWLPVSAVLAFFRSCIAQTGLVFGEAECFQDVMDDHG